MSQRYPGLDSTITLGVLPVNQVSCWQGPGLDPGIPLRESFHDPGVMVVGLQQDFEVMSAGCPWGPKLDPVITLGVFLHDPGIMLAGF